MKLKTAITIVASLIALDSQAQCGPEWHRLLAEVVTTQQMAALNAVSQTSNASRIRGASEVMPDNSELKTLLRQSAKDAAESIRLLSLANKAMDNLVLSPCSKNTLK